LNGILASVVSGSGSSEPVTFDAATFAQFSVTSSDPEDYGGGTYTYLKVGTNLAQLSLSFTLPPGNSNSLGPIDLVFTNHYNGYFTNEDGGDTGGISLHVASAALVPTSVVGKTLSAVSGSDGKTTKIKLTTAVGFTKTPANNSSSGSSSGNYTFTRLSPVCAVFAFSFTSAADVGQTAYVQATFTSGIGGTYFAMVFDKFGALQDVDTGSFSM
jgi:hypothetical protein